MERVNLNHHLPVPNPLPWLMEHLVSRTQGRCEFENCCLLAGAGSSPETAVAEVEIPTQTCYLVLCPSEATKNDTQLAGALLCPSLSSKGEVAAPTSSKSLFSILHSLQPPLVCDTPMIQGRQVPPQYN